jgi:hypothetical protein
MQLVDAPGPARLIDHEPGLFEQAQVPGYGRAADRERLGDLADGPATGAEQFDDGATVAVAQSVEWITRERSGSHDGSVTKMLPLSEPEGKHHSTEGGRGEILRSELDDCGQA